MSRARNPMSETSQLRVDDVPVEILSMLDAVSMADGFKSRGPLVILVLRRWARQEARKHSLISKILNSNQTIEDLAGMESE